MVPSAPWSRSAPSAATGRDHRRRATPEVELLQALADSTAVALENVRVYEQLEAARLETLHRLALAAEFRDDDTYEHTERVAGPPPCSPSGWGWTPARSS